MNDRIVMTDLVKRYGTRTVVKNVSADVRRGEVVGLLGPNGAGKTTTFYMVVGLVRPDGGSVVAGARRRQPRHHALADARTRARRDRLSRARELDLPQALGRRQPALDLGDERRRRGGARTASARAARRIRALGARSTRAATRSRAASAGASRSRGRSRPNRRSCCSTNRSPASIRSRSPTSRR